MIIEPLTGLDILDEYDCGIHALNVFIIKNAFASKTYLLKKNENICGFYSISATVIEQNQVDIRWPKHPLPAVLLGRLAVDLKFQHQGLGAILFADACKKTLLIAETIGCVGLITEAKDKNAIKFYTKFGMSPFKNKPNTLFIKTKTMLNCMSNKI